MIEESDVGVGSRCVPERLRRELLQTVVLHLTRHRLRRVLHIRRCLKGWRL